MLYGKLFEQMYDGTLGTRGPWQALITFQQLIILADADGVVDMTVEAIARRTTIPLEIIAAGIAALEEPDAQSRTPTAEGRRITRVSETREWGWHITNYDFYKKLRSGDERRAYMRQYQRERRAKEKPVNTPSTPVNNVNRLNPLSMEYGVSSMEYGELTNYGFALTWKLYPKRAGGNSRADAEKCWNARIKNGVSEQELHEGTARYAAFCVATGKVGTEYVKQARTFYGPAGHWRELWEIPAKKVAKGEIDWNAASKEAKRLDDEERDARPRNA